MAACSTIPKMKSSAAEKGSMKRIVVTLVATCLILLLPECALITKGADSPGNPQPSASSSAAAASAAAASVAQPQSQSLVPVAAIQPQAPFPAGPIQLLIPLATPGRRVLKNDEAEIDYSNIKDGYIMARYMKPTKQALRLLVATPNKIEYVYPLADNGKFEVFPFSEGNGAYTITIYKQTAGSQVSNAYTTVLSLSLDVQIKNETAPFLIPNLFVNFSEKSLFMEKTAEFATLRDNREIVEAIYKFIIQNVKYNKDTVEEEDWYIPDLDRVYTELTGICIDYATLMVAMARSAGVPARLVTGYTRDGCHAWVEIYFEQTGWERMDPTVFAVGRVQRNNLAFIADDSNYTRMYQY